MHYGTVMILISIRRLLAVPRDRWELTYLVRRRIHFLLGLSIVPVRDHVRSQIDELCDSYRDIECNAPDRLTSTSFDATMKVNNRHSPMTDRQADASSRICLDQVRERPLKTSSQLP